MTGRIDQIRYVDIPDSFTTDAATMTNGELEDKYKRGEATIGRWRKVVKVPSPNSSQASRYTFPDPQAKDYLDAGIIKIEGDCIVTSDWHIPYHDLSLAENMVRLAEKLKIKQLAIVGDFFDAAMLSIFDPQDIEFGIGQELAATQHTITHLLKFFQRIYWSLGNHEIRLLRSLKFQVTLDDICHYLTHGDRVVATPLPYMMLESGSLSFRLTHPGSYSRITSNVARQLAVNFQTNIMSGHDHLFGFCMDPSGKYQAIDLGGLFNPHKLAYKVVRGDTTHPLPQSGFWIVRNGVTTPYSPTITNWDVIV